MVYLAVSKKRQRVKIGFTDNLAERMSTLRREEAEDLKVELELVGDRKVEGELHMLFVSHRREGEWFVLDSEVQDFISAGGELWTVRQIITPVDFWCGAPTRQDVEAANDWGGDAGIPLKERFASAARVALRRFGRDADDLLDEHVVGWSCADGLALEPNVLAWKSGNNGTTYIAKCVKQFRRAR